MKICFPGEKRPLRNPDELGKLALAKSQRFSRCPDPVADRLAGRAPSVPVFSEASKTEL